MTPLKSDDPKSIKGWQLLGRLGAGGTGLVYLANDDNGRTAAVKVLRSELSDNALVRERLKREAQILTRVKGGRTAIIYEVDAECETPFIAMEYVRGLTLNDYVAANSPVKGALAWTLVDALIEALQAIHAAGVIHRDLKPSNVLIGEDGVKVVDFGISVLQDVSHSTQTGTLIGTVAWLSPEQITGTEITESSDVFNLGMVLAFALSAMHPFGEGRPDAVMFRIAHGEPDLSKVSAQFIPIVSACLSKNPKDRPKLENLAVMLKGISRSESADSQPINDGRTLIVDRTSLEQSIQTNSEALSVGNLKASTSSETVSKPDFEVGNKNKMLAIVAAGVLVCAGIFGVVQARENSSSDFSSSTSVVEVLDSTPTTFTVPVVPRFKVSEYEGRGLRFDPCAGVITVAVNYGSLPAYKQDQVTKILQSSLSFISGESGLEFLFTGSSDAVPKDPWRDARNGSKAILFGFFEPGESGAKMIKAGEEWGSEESRFISNTSSSSQWTAMLGMDVQIVPSRFSGEISLTVALRRSLLLSIGLTWVDEPTGWESAELLGARIGVETLTPLKRTPEWGPGDILGMKAVGKSNGCIG